MWQNLGYRKNRRYIWRDEELTSRISGSEVTASLANLGIRYPGEVDSEGKIKDHPIDICLATNMISVGLDVSRLGLMTVAGQPKTTSEYIQATSRVGRSAKNAPGLVFVLYRPGRPRDKSHYEHFRSYHSRVYCNVEPTSVTPFSAPVRERALHAIMVGMMRLESDDRFNEDPPRFPDDDLIDKVRSVIENRVEDIDSEELYATLDRMEYILQCWEDWNPRKWEPAKNPDWSYADPVPLGRAMSVTESHSYSSDCNFYNASVPTAEKIAALKSYLQNMKMSYSYKPILVMALMQSGKPGVVSIEKATRFFRKYYADRREQGLTPEKRRCIYLREDVSDKQIAANLVSNPVKALCESGFFFFNEKEQIFSLSPEIWPFLDKGNKAAITKICKQRLKEYYSE